MACAVAGLFCFEGPRRSNFARLGHQPGRTANIASRGALMRRVQSVCWSVKAVKQSPWWSAERPRRATWWSCRIGRGHLSPTLRLRLPSARDCLKISFPSNRITSTARLDGARNFVCQVFSYSRRNRRSRVRLSATDSKKRTQLSVQRRQFRIGGQALRRRPARRP